jgi:hypothetical protein
VRDRVILRDVLSELLGRVGVRFCQTGKSGRRARMALAELLANSAELRPSALLPWLPDAT